MKTQTIVVSIVVAVVLAIGGVIAYFMFRKTEADCIRCVAQVGDVEVKLRSVRMIMMATRAGTTEDRKTQALDLALQRAFLIEEANKRGLRVSKEQAEEKIKAGDIVIAGERVDGKGLYFEEDFFSYKQFKAFVQHLMLETVAQFTEEQQLEHAAYAAKQAIGGDLSKWFAEKCAAAVKSKHLVLYDKQIAPLFESTKYQPCQGRL